VLTIPKEMMIVMSRDEGLEVGGARNHQYLRQSYHLGTAWSADQVVVAGVLVG